MIAVVGLALVALGVGPRVALVRELRRRGYPWSLVLRPLYFNASIWLGASFLVGLASPIVGGLMLVTSGAVGIFVFVRAGVKGVWRFPTAARLIGDPEAWRGERKPYWESEREQSK